ncbi:hypothetical protein EC968_001218 [Mortierella alpina]|nr:hypothetical protein EC968_001218 [Mortierella alpina]
MSENWYTPPSPPPQSLPISTAGWEYHAKSPRSTEDSFEPPWVNQAETSGWDSPVAQDAVQSRDREGLSLVPQSSSTSSWQKADDRLSKEYIQVDFSRQASALFHYHTRQYLEAVTTSDPMVDIRLVFTAHHLPRGDDFVNLLGPLRVKHLVDTYVIPHEFTSVDEDSDVVLGLSGTLSRVCDALEGFLQSLAAQSGGFSLWLLYLLVPCPIGHLLVGVHDWELGNDLHRGVVDSLIPSFQKVMGRLYGPISVAQDECIFALQSCNLSTIMEAVMLVGEICAQEETAVGGCSHFYRGGHPSVLPKEIIPHALDLHLLSTALDPKVPAGYILRQEMRNCIKDLQKTKHHLQLIVPTTDAQLLTEELDMTLRNRLDPLGAGVRISDPISLQDDVYRVCDVGADGRTPLVMAVMEVVRWMVKKSLTGWSIKVYIPERVVAALRSPGTANSWRSQGIDYDIKPSLAFGGQTGGDNVALEPAEQESVLLVSQSAAVDIENAVRQVARKDAIRDNVLRPSRVVPYPSKDGKPIYTSEFFGENVFGQAQIAKALPKPAYAQFVRQMKGGQTLDKGTADAIAHAVRIWAMDKGATHFTHWFQPQTGTTAEKHDAFLTLKSTHGPSGVEGITAIDAFSGSQLLQAEPDASSFPSGGMRTTFEARGYTVWDTTSPMFIQHGPHQTCVLYIPSIFISYNGDALDEKTVLLRSTEQVAKAALAVLALLEPVPPGAPPQTTCVYTTLGTEQEYFLVDRSLYVLRPDLKITGRTLVGALPAKHQQMEDHYFGHIPSRVLATMSEAELELYKLGVPVKTRHNEVAPQQFELAPIFEETSLAVDHNLLTMDVLSKVAHRNNLKVLFHEKPFKGVNGSGKHCNWSLSTGSGENLLDPTIKPETNYRFLLFLLATLDAVQRHGGLLRAGIASASNEHRLGANEAPPAIISVFLGEHLTEVLDSIEENRPIKNFSMPNIQTIKLGGRALDVMVSSLPEISRDLTDRNRTSPFAFTGNKFEFRAVGSKQSPSFPMTLLNAAVASSLQDIAEALKKAAGSKPYPSDADKLAVVRQYIAATKNVRFEGDNYSDEWRKEAAKRGLLNITNCPDAFDQIVEEKNSAVLCKLGIFSKSELQSRHYILMERYSKDLLLEANTLRTILAQQVLPAAYEYRASLAGSCAQQKQLGIAAGPELRTLKQTTPLVEDLLDWIEKLDEAINKVHEEGHEPSKEARASAKYLLPAMEGARDVADELETVLADKYFPLPKMSELLWF